MTSDEIKNHIFGIPLGSDYPREFVLGLLEKYKDKPPHEIARINIIVNTSRMRTRLTNIFADQGCMLLPRLHLISDLTDLMRGDLTSFDANTMAEKFELIRLVSKLLNAQPHFAPKTSLFALSDSLQDLVNEIAEENISADAIMNLNVQDQSGHWQNTLEFLKIVFQYLDHHEGQIASSKLSNQVRAIGDIWSKLPMLEPVYLVGSTGSRKPALDLMKSVSELPNGNIVLPGFDFDAPPSMWSHLLSDRANEDHPQFRLAKVIQSCGGHPTNLASWSNSVTNMDRSALISLSLRPAPVTDSWMKEGPGLKNLPDATAGITLIEATSKRQEALAIALRLRQAVDSGETATLITPDREISRYVSSIMSRWDITPDDSAGVPLSLTPVGRFIRETAALVSSEIKISQIFAILKHPMCHAGQQRGDHLLLTRELELYLRKNGIVSLLPSVLEKWAERQTNEMTSEWVHWFSKSFLSLQETRTQNFASWLHHHVILTEQIAMGCNALCAEDASLRATQSGKPIFELIKNLRETIETSLDCEFSDYIGILNGLLSSASLRETVQTHPRVLIWGTLEARVQGADFYILAGLNEGIWPETGDSDPWLNRQMRKDVGLRVPERKIGLSAHDYQQLVCQENVWITRSIRSDDAETVPSRWINRLMNLLNGIPDKSGQVALENMRARGRVWLEFAESIDGFDPTMVSGSAPRPAPCPPVHARPKSMAVTDIRTLIRDPYSIYAKHILKLRRLNPLNALPDARMRGTVVHQVLETYFRNWEAISPAERKNAFMTVLDDTLRETVPWPVTQIFWRNRLEQVVDWLIKDEIKRRLVAEPVGFEAVGKFEITDLQFTLRAIADRIDQRRDGSLVIYDYKTGTAPTEKQQLFFDKQLYMLSIIAENVGFQNIEPNTVFDAQFIGLGTPAKVVQIPIEKESLEQANTKLRHLISSYSDQDQGYTARRALFKSSDFSDYDHLSRFGEWDTSHPPKKERFQ